MLAHAIFPTLMFWNTHQSETKNVSFGRLISSTERMDRSHITKMESSMSHTVSRSKKCLVIWKVQCTGPQSMTALLCMITQDSVVLNNGVVNTCHITAWALCTIMDNYIQVCQRTGQYIPRGPDSLSNSIMWSNQSLKKPVEQTKKIISRPISLVHSTGFLQQLIWSDDKSKSGSGP